MHNSPALMTLLFTACAGSLASIWVRGQNDHDKTITIIHETLTEVRSYDQGGSEEGEPFIVQNGESVTILVRWRCSIIACGIFEVDVRLCDRAGAVLAPRAISNMALDQCEEALIERACATAMARVGLGGEK